DPHTLSPAHKEHLIAAADWVLIELRLSVKVIRLRFIFHLWDEQSRPAYFTRRLNELA
ncbi:tRNA pseudouridine synthase A, partial [Dissostichus eleginoides]